VNKVNDLMRLKDMSMRTLALTFVLAATAVGLSACQSMSPEERRAADNRQCMSYGFKRGTDAFATCLQRIDLERQARARYDSDMVMMDMSYSLGGPYYGGPYYGRRYR
jgi:hypothetical protein